MVMFDGKGFAQKIEESLGKINTKLMVLLDPKNEAGASYVKAKQLVGERLGVEVVVANTPEIEKWNCDPSIGGILIQLPFAGSEKLIPLIDLKKDVDGLREDSPYVPATVRAVLAILNSNLQTVNQILAKPALGEQNARLKMCVVGNRGVVGMGLMKHLPGAFGMDRQDFDPTSPRLRGASVVISATGRAGIIRPEMVKEGVVAIDVGYPKGDFDPAVAYKASLFTPVPGGVGPVTVVMLFANLAKAVSVG